MKESGNGSEYIARIRQIHLESLGKQTLKDISLLTQKCSQLVLALACQCGQKAVYYEQGNHFCQSCRSPEAKPIRPLLERIGEFQSLLPSLFLEDELIEIESLFKALSQILREIERCSYERIQQSYESFCRSIGGYLTDVNELKSSFRKVRSFDLLQKIVELHELSCSHRDKLYEEVNCELDFIRNIVVEFREMLGSEGTLETTQFQRSCNSFTDIFEQTRGPRKEKQCWSQEFSKMVEENRVERKHGKILFSAALKLPKEKVIQKMTLYLSAIKCYPEYAPAHTNLGLIYKAKGNTEDAVREFQLACKGRESNGMCAVNLGVLYHQLGRLDLAEKTYQEATKRINMQNAGLYINYGVLLRQLGKKEEAKRAYEKAIQLQPMSSCAYDNLGVLYYKERDYQKAEEMYKRAVQLDGNNVSALYNYGLLLNLTRGKEKARPMFQAAAKLGHEKACLLAYGDD